MLAKQEAHEQKTLHVEALLALPEGEALVVVEDGVGGALIVEHFGVVQIYLPRYSLQMLIIQIVFVPEAHHGTHENLV